MFAAVRDEFCPTALLDDAVRWARRTGRKNLLILENVDEILDAQFDDDFGLKQLRSELMSRTRKSGPS